MVVVGLFRAADEYGKILIWELLVRLDWDSRSGLVKACQWNFCINLHQPPCASVPFGADFAPNTKFVSA